MMARVTASSIAALLLVSLAGMAGCGAPVDVKQVVQITDISGGWYDAGIKDGKNKLTPSVTFRVKKSSDDAIRPLALNLAFKKITAAGEEDFDDFYVQSVSFGDGNVSEPLTVRTETGYTADAAAVARRHAQAQGLPGSPRHLLRQAQLVQLGRAGTLRPAAHVDHPLTGRLRCVVHRSHHAFGRTQPC